MFFVLSHRRWGLVVSLVGLAFVGCRVTPNLSTPSPTPPPITTESPASPTPVATVRDIVARPVWVQSPQGEVDAQVGMAMAYGDTIRTKNPALVEVSLGEVVFRLGGQAALTLSPNQTLQFTGGQMLTWLEGSPPGPVTITTPVGVAGIRGTTVFINIADDPQQPVEIFAWEGEVTFQPTGSTDVVVIRDGEQLLISPGAIDGANLQSQVRRFEPEEFRQRLAASPLIHGLNSPLPTLSTIEAVGDTLDSGKP